MSSIPVLPSALDVDTSSLGLALPQTTSQTTYGDQMQLVSPSSTITFLPPFTDSSPPTTSTLLFSTEPNDTLQTNISSLSVASSSYAVSRLQAAMIPPITTPLPPPPPSPPPPSHVVPPDDSSFTRQTPPIRRSGYISLIDHESELSGFHSRSHTFTSRFSGQRQPTFNTPLSSNRRKFKSRTTPSRRCSDDEDERLPETDWRDLLSQSQDCDPRRTFELLQLRSQLLDELTRIRRSR